MRDPLTPAQDYVEHAAARRIIVGILLAMLLAALEGRPDMAETLHASFERMLARYREVEGMLPHHAAKARPKRDFRRRRRA